MKKPAARAWIHAADHPWAMTEAALRQLLDIAARETSESWEAVAAKLGKPLEATWSVENRNGVAVVPVAGPIFRYANLFTMFSGGTSVQDLATDFQASIDDPSVKAILLNIDSPGGEVAGINEMASMIRVAAAGKKPVMAYVGGMAASAAYWLASQTQAIIADPTALLGSIGIVATFRDRKAADEKAGIANYEIVSSQSPKKRLDPGTDSGRAAIQITIDDLAAEFVASVAAGRGVTEEKVLTDFGQGGVMTAKRAIAAGMADQLGSFESVLAELAATGTGKTYSFGATGVNYPNKGALFMEDKNKPVDTKPEGPPVDVGAVTAKAEGVKEGTALGVKSERTRIAAILNSEEAKGRESLARAMSLESDLDPEAARKMLAASPIPAAAPANALAAAMGDLKNPKVGVQGGEVDEEKALIDGVLAFTSKGGKK